MEKGKFDISRRNFLMGAGAVVFGAGAAGALTGCAPQTAALKDPEGEEANDQKVYEPNSQDESWTSFTTDYSALFSPIAIGSLTLKNRIIKSSAGSDTTSKEEQKVPEVSKAAIEYYRRIAAGGAAMIVLEADTLKHLGFSPNTAASSLATQDRDEQIAAVMPLVDAVHEHGCYIAARFRAPGGMEGGAVDSLTADDIAAYVAECGDMASKLKEAGFDGVEVKAATTDGINEFVSRRSNKREDQYGPQSMENRARFMVEQIQAIKSAAGSDFVVLAVINFAEENVETLGDNDDFISIGESKEFARRIEQAGADLIQVRTATPGVEINSWAPDVAHAGYKRDGMTGKGGRFLYEKHFSGMEDGRHGGSGAFIPAAAAVKEVVSVPVGCAGSMDPRLAPDLIDGAVAEGRVDVVFLNRPLNVDPQLPNKLHEGRRDEVAPCCRCMHCHTAGFEPREPERCRVNAALQVAYRDEMPEGYDPLPAERPKNVLVVGGGPAGMEAARVAAQRGHKVKLYEKDENLGGLLRTASAFKGNHEQLAELASYLSKQLEPNGVEVVTGVEVTADSIASEAPDAVILAVGGVRRSVLSGNDAVKVLGIGDVPSDEAGDEIVILGAGVQAIDAAMFLQAKGKSVQLVHDGNESSIDKEQSCWYRYMIVPDLYASGVHIWNNAKVEKVVDEGLLIANAGGVEQTIRCDTVFEIYDMVANTELYDAIKDDYEVIAVGDCAEPWNIQKAISTGNLAARAL